MSGSRVPLRGLTLTHPYARCVRDFGKPVENRYWHLKSRGGVVGMYLAIHGGKPPRPGENQPWLDFEADVRGVVRDLIEPGHVPPELVKPLTVQDEAGAWRLPYPSMILPGIVAVARVAAVVRNHPSPWAAHDQWQFVLEDLLRFDQPIPHKGAQGLWLLDEAPFAEVVLAWKIAHGGVCPFEGSEFRRSAA